jgi:hypothetical protein
LAPTFGNDKFALRAEAFARFFGTPTFLGAQTLIVAVWIALNISGVTHFDVYPSSCSTWRSACKRRTPHLDSAGTDRQAARDKAQSDADAQHREALATANSERQAEAAKNTAQLLELLEQNTRLTELTKALSERIENLTSEMHQHVLNSTPSKS